MASQLFAPKPGETFSIAATTSSQSAALNSTAAAATSFRVYNAGNVVAFVRFQTGSGNASVTASMPIAPGSVEIFRKLDAWDTVSAITAGGNATVYFTPGEGI